MNTKTFDREKLVLPWEEEIEFMRDRLIDKAVSEGKDTSPEYLIHIAEKLKACEQMEKVLQALEAIRRDIWETALEGELDDDKAEQRDGLRKISIVLTEGMINQHMLTLTKACKKGLVRLGEVMVIQLPDGERFETEIIAPGNRLRERGRIREFYQAHDARFDDTVMLTETAKGVWTISLEKNPLHEIVKEVLDQ